MNFEKLCEFFETVRHKRTPSEKQQITREFFQTVRTNPKQCYQILRLIVPKLDRNRQAYRIKESKICRLIIKMLSLPNGNDKTLLTKTSTITTGNFGEIVFTILKKYISTQQTIVTTDEINEYLDRIANRTNDSGLDDLILAIFRKLSSIATKWFIQILLKDLKLGIGDNTILNCYHDDGGQYYNINNNLTKLCEVLFDRTKKLHELEVQIFEPFRPMLSKRCDTSNFNKCFHDTKTYIVENKFDGERFQLHMENGEFRYFSRNGHNFTDIYGNDYNNGLLTPLLKNVFNPDVKRVILDGEMMLWNKKLQTFGCKGMKYDVKKLTTTGNYQPCFCVFDIILHNDEILTNQPLKVRIDYLKRTLQNPIDGVIIKSRTKLAKNRQQIIDALNESVDNNEEGIIVKDPNSIYKCSERNCGWYKIKMEYFDDDVVEDLDLLLMGGYGSTTKMNSFMVGLSSGRNTYLSLSRISSGLTADQIDLLTTRLLQDGCIFGEFARKSEGKLQFGRDTPDFYIEPDRSILLKVRATELIRTENNAVKTMYTLRFPRVMALRPDKPTHKCLKMDELLDLTRNREVIKLHKRHIELAEINKSNNNNNNRKKRRLVTSVVQLKKYENLDDLLDNRKFYVISNDDSWKIDDIDIAIKSAGGLLVYQLQPDIDIILTSKLDNRTISLMKTVDRYDIIHTNWLRRVLTTRQLSPYRHEEVFKIGHNYKSDLSCNVDRFGDSFLDETTIDQLKFTFDLMNQQSCFVNCNNSIQFDQNLFRFIDFIGYFDCYETINDENSTQIYDCLIDQIQFRYYKGCINRKLDKNCNLIVINDEKRRALILEFLNSLGCDSHGVQIVDRNFLYDFRELDI